MKYMDIGCKINCWRCERDCEIKHLMEYSTINPIFEQFFYYSIIEFLKPQAGLLITRGINPAAVNEEVKILAVSFYVARKKFIESLRKK